MPQDFINYTTGQPNPTPLVPGSEYVPPASNQKGDSPTSKEWMEHNVTSRVPTPKASKASSEDNEIYMKGVMAKQAKSRVPKPPSDYAMARAARKK